MPVSCLLPRWLPILSQRFHDTPAPAANQPLENPTCPSSVTIPMQKENATKEKYDRDGIRTRAPFETRMYSCLNANSGDS